ncbi:patatin-like phospholipase family protein [Pontivivens ytuae]|uniref:Patatin-like phospholipase family protein n=1 Tax=Pontivivens ytuae TaxID=2789856 RepID=A0A7S9LV67_9RHOB|nr:patatin-like phospholipase family protein [Pontivivens ytuae]QPH55872.1 patatin-like phospholipase family protein [Pontivivens ytuae]
MAKGQGRGPQHTKSINLALQGGGAHGAFTWGVLDRMFEEDPLWIEAISGTSAGAMNAVVAAQGMYDNGAAGAREALHDFWSEVSRAGRGSPIQRTPFDVAWGNWSLDNAPGYLMLDMMSRLASPYDMNPFGLNPLRDVVKNFVDFEKVSGEDDMGVFLSATNVETGQPRVFHRHEITLDVVMASACLPFMFQAVEIDGVPYWDGGYVGNPVLFPFIDHSPCADILIVQINPMERKGTPRAARDILNRVNEITFNASLLSDLRTIDFVDQMIEQGHLSTDDYRQMRVHMIDGAVEMLNLTASSKLNAEWAFLTHLRDIGRGAADRWLKTHFDDIDNRSTLDLRSVLPVMGSPRNRVPEAPKTQT